MDKNTSSFDAAGNVSYLPVLPSACPPRLAGLISDDESANSYFTISLGAPWALTSTSRPEGLQKKKTPVMADLKYLNYKIINSNCLLFKVTNMQMGQTY